MHRDDIRHAQGRRRRRVDAPPADISEATRFLAGDEQGGYFLAKDGATALASRLRLGDVPASPADWAGGFYGVDLPGGDGSAVCLGFDSDAIGAGPDDAWTVFHLDAGYDLVGATSTGMALRDAVVLAIRRSGDGAV